ncbi:MAG TPA: flap endonuclease-1 [Nitrososphaera sp.]|jgi:flap endonuclease-1
MGLDIRSLVTPRMIRLAELTGKVIAIDAYNTLYQFLSIIRGPTGELLTDSRGEVTSHLSGLFYRNANLMMENIKVVYVFDGKASELKKSEIKHRSNLKKEAFQKYQAAIEEGRIEDARKYSTRTAVLTDKMVEDSKELLSYLGIPTIDAPSEGESAASYLTKRDIAFAVGSQDYDSILFGAKKLVRNLTISGKRKIPGRNTYIDIDPEILEHDKVLTETGLTHEQLVDVGILIGTDFNPSGFPGIGPKTAIKLIKQNGRLENIERIEHQINHVPYQEIRDIFLNPESPNLDNMEFGEVQHDTVLEFLCAKRNFSTDRVNTTLEKLQKSRTNRSQSLEQWFE